MNANIKKLNKEKFEDRLNQLVLTADTYIEYAIRYKDILSEYRRKKKKPTPLLKSRTAEDQLLSFLKINANVFLFQSILNLRTLLKKTMDNEFSFEKYFVEFGNFQEKISKIRSEFERLELKLLSNKIIAHKEMQYIPSPWILCTLDLEEKYFKNVRIIVDMLKKVVTEEFDVECNNYILSSSEIGLDKVRGYIKSCLDIDR